MSLIRFHSEDVSYRLRGIGVYRDWIGKCIRNHQRKIGAINIIFTSDPYLLEINRSYLNHNYFTDVISFDYSEDAVVSGDIYISLDTVRKNAREYGVSVGMELRRVMIHGILHLVGYKDNSTEEKEIMRNMENEALHLW